MLKSKKNVIWEALVVTVAIFLAGLFFGVLMEQGNSAKISNLYLQSEISLADAMATSRLTEDFNFNCNEIKQSNIDFANRIYEEAKLLEKYEESGELTSGMSLLHKKYSLLRTLLWTSNQKSLNRCNNYNLVVYLYESQNEDTAVKAKQNVWSKILLDMKMENNDILLLPIAADQNLTSLDLLIDEHGITNFPALIINNDKVLYSLESVESTQAFLD
ncbi:MAG: hypothetical protein OEL87_02030 [Nanoarchaeota archaeon]|nr:hypothetical protein [Nanoarchaeota archaeon]